MPFLQDSLLVDHEEFKQYIPFSLFSFADPFRSLVVRFLLPPPPITPNMPPSEVAAEPDTHEYDTTETPLTEKVAFNKFACRWTKSDLDLLGVDYQFQRFDPIPREVLENNDMPLELVESSNPYNSRANVSY